MSHQHRFRSTFFAILHSIVSCFSFFRIDVFVCRLQNKSFEANTNPQHTYIHVPTQFYLLCFGQTSECGPIGWHYNIKLHRSRYYMCEPHNRRWRTEKKSHAHNWFRWYIMLVWWFCLRVCVLFDIPWLPQEKKGRERTGKQNPINYFVFGGFSV